MYLHYILKERQLSDTVSTTISKVDVFTISFQLTCKFIHTSYDNTTLANAYFMSFFLSIQTLYYIITLLWNTASTAQTQTSFHAIFLFSHIKVSVSFTF